MDPSRSDIRPAALAGTWYPEDPEYLRKTIAQYMESASAPVLPGTVAGLVVPHAGHIYSGPVAAYAYRQIMGRRYGTVIVIAPNHVDPRLAFSSVLVRGAYQTPLGTVPVDAGVAEAIVRAGGSGKVRASDAGHLSGYGGRFEHSIEIQLPFLQFALGEFRLVPIVMGSQDREAVSALAEAISAVAGDDDVLVVGSSDLSHFYPSAEARDYDARVKGYIERFDPEGLLADDIVEEGHVCGRGPIAVTMLVCRARGATRPVVLRMADSGNVTGDSRSVVGYLAAAFVRPEERELIPEEQNTAVSGPNPRLSDDEKDVLLDVVRRTLGDVVRERRIPRFDRMDGRLGEKWGAFVTLTKHGNLRGCIGNIVGTRPLIETVAEMARAAALEDPRFPPVREEELPDIEFEISVLTPIRRVRDVNKIIVGRDGIIITRGYNRGLLLPQVATEYGWDRETFLEQTCRKAGLPRDAWKDPDSMIEAFSAEVFH